MIFQVFVDSYPQPCLLVCTVQSTLLKLDDSIVKSSSRVQSSVFFTQRWDRRLNLNSPQMILSGKPQGKLVLFAVCTEEDPVEEAEEVYNAC